MTELIFKAEFYQIKNACIEIRRVLGNGFLEKIYENALKYELESKGFHVESQKEIVVSYKNKVVGMYYADLIINEKIIVELKCFSQITSFHKSQLLHYLRATGFQLGLLINFPNDSPGFQIERVPNFIKTN